MEPAPLIPRWDVGERPNVRMAYIDYPEYEPGPLTAHRDDVGLRSKVGGSKEEREVRESERHATGWACERREKYRPLGKLEELPMAGAEIRQQKSAAYRRPKIVLPREVRAHEVQHQSSTTRLVPGKKVHGTLREFTYTYYEIEMHERIRLVLTLKTFTGDPDIFVSTTGLPTTDEFIWKSAGRPMLPISHPIFPLISPPIPHLHPTPPVRNPPTPRPAPINTATHHPHPSGSGDDEIIISTDHPSYVLGIYYVGVYAICDSEFELETRLEKEPITLRAKLELQGNGFSTLNDLVHDAELRRKACKFGAPVHKSPPPPKEHAKMLHALPVHLQAALTPRPKWSSKGGGCSGLGGGGSSADLSGGAPEPSSPALRASSSSVLSLRRSSKREPLVVDPEAVPVLTNSYLTSLCFGSAVGPRGPHRPPEAIEEGHPWLSAEGCALESSRVAKVTAMNARAPVELKPRLMQEGHHATKEDMETQMARVARGLEMERPLIRSGTA